MLLQPPALRKASTCSATGSSPAQAALQRAHNWQEKNVRFNRGSLSDGFILPSNNRRKIWLRPRGEKASSLCNRYEGQLCTQAFQRVQQSTLQASVRGPRGPDTKR